MSTNHIPFVDLRGQHEEVRNQIESAIADIIDRSTFIGGTYVSNFEREFADYLGVKEVVGVANGTDAVWLALIVAGVKPGDAVITVPNTFIATVEAIKQAGHPRIALWGASLAFAAIHVNLATFLPLLLLALILTWLYETTGNLLAPIAAHSLFNTMNFVLLYVAESLHLVSARP